MTSVNHSKKFIFLHIPKNAGTYIQHILHKYYGCTNYNYLIRYDLDEVKFSIMNEKKKNNESIYRSNPYSSKILGIHRYFSTSQSLLYNMCLNDKLWDEMYKFAFVRDPYSRFISSWNFVLNGFKNKNNILKNSIGMEDIEKYKNIKYFIENKDNLTDIAYNHIFITQFLHIVDKELNVNLNYIGKIENIEEDLENIITQLGFKSIIHLSTNKINKKEYSPYKQYYDQFILDFVNEWFDDDFKHFKYKKYTTIEDFLLN